MSTEPLYELSGMSQQEFQYRMAEGIASTEPKYDPDAYEEYLKLAVPGYRDKFMEDYQPGSRYVGDAPVRMDVINFIADMLYNTGADPISVHRLFKCGYCYHFAVILEHEFGGRIYWVRNCGHMVWVDENNLAYDIEGYRNDLDIDEHLATIEELELIGGTDIERNLESFRHRYLDLKP